MLNVKKLVENLLRQYGVAGSPDTETETTPDRWEIIAGAAPIVQDGVPSLLVLTVFSGFGKKIAVLTNFNEVSYLRDNYLKL